MNTSNLIIGALFIAIFAGYTQYRRQRGLYLGQLIEVVSEKIIENIKTHYFHKIDGVLIQLSITQDSDHISLFLQDVLKQYGCTIMSHSSYSIDGFNFLFLGQGGYKITCEVHRVKNKYHPGITYIISFV